MSPKVTSDWCPGAYLTNERFDDGYALFEEKHVLLYVLLIIALTLAKITLKKPYLLFQKMCAPENQKSMDSCFEQKRDHLCVEPVN